MIYTNLTSQRYHFTNDNDIGLKLEVNYEKSQHFPDTWYYVVYLNGEYVHLFNKNEFHKLGELLHGIHAATRCVNFTIPHQRRQLEEVIIR